MEQMLGYLAVIEARLQRAVRCQKVSGTQVAGARLLDPYRTARPQGRVEGPQRLPNPKAPPPAPLPRCPLAQPGPGSEISGVLPGPRVLSLWPGLNQEKDPRDPVGDQRGYRLLSMSHIFVLTFHFSHFTHDEYLSLE